MSDDKKDLGSIFGEPEYDEHGDMIFHTEIVPWLPMEKDPLKRPRGFTIRFSAKGFGFGGVEVGISEGKLYADTERMGPETVAHIIRAASEQLGALLVDLDEHGKKPPASDPSGEAK